MASSFATSSFNPRMIVAQPTFIIAALAIVGVVGFYILRRNSTTNTSSNTKQPTGQADTPTDSTIAAGTLNQIQQQISVFEQQMASLPTTPHVPVSNSPVAVGVGGHSTT